MMDEEGPENRDERHAAKNRILGVRDDLQAPLLCRKSPHLARLAMLS